MARQTHADDVRLGRIAHSLRVDRLAVGGRGPPMAIGPVAGLAFDATGILGKGAGPGFMSKTDDLACLGFVE